jgi:hypothetical protein
MTWQRRAALTAASEVGLWWAAALLRRASQDRKAS